MDVNKLNALLSQFPARELVDGSGDPTGLIVTMPCRLQFPALDKPKRAPNSTRETYSACLLIPPQADMTTLRAFAKRYAVTIKAAKINNPIRDGAEKVGKIDGIEAGWHFINVASNAVNPKTGEVMQPPALVNPDLTRAEASAFYAGAWVVAKLSAYTYNTNGNAGVSFGLRSLQLIAHDAQLRTGADPSDGFTAIKGVANARADVAASGMAAVAGAPAVPASNELPGW